MTKKEPLPFTLDEKRARFGFSYNALTKGEQKAIRILYDGGNAPAMTPYEVYSQMVRDEIKRLSVADEIQKKFDKEEDGRKIHYSYEDFGKYLNEKYMSGLPSYGAIRNICLDFHIIGWVSARKEMSSTKYYLTKQTIDVLKLTSF